MDIDSIRQNRRRGVSSNNEAMLAWLSLQQQKNQESAAPLRLSMRSDATKTAVSPTAVIQVKQPRNRHQIANALIKSRLKQQQQAPQISLQKSMLKPSRRPRFHPTLAADELFPSFLGDTGIENSFMLEDRQVMNTFYNAPVGRENWSIKHI